MKTCKISEIKILKTCNSEKTLMKRKICDELIAWKNDSADKTALLIDGARRVGKSFIAESFAKNEYKSYILVDFNRAGTEIRDLFEHYLNDLDTLFMCLSGYYNVKLYKGESRMEIDFLIAKSKINSRHNISPIEVKSGRNYTLTSLRKFMKKYAEQADVPYVLHTKDLKVEEGIVFLPLYMTPLL